MPQRTHRSPAAVVGAGLSVFAAFHSAAAPVLAQCGTNTWVRLSAAEPSPRASPAMAYHQASRQTILFGGMIGLAWPDVGAHGETLSWNGTAWTQLTPGGTVPFKRFETPMTYDSARKRLVMHSGAAIEWSPSNHHIPGTFEFDGVNWFQASPTGPLARHAHGLVYDAARNKTVMIQGKHGMDDTWEWDGNAATWTFRLNGQMNSRAWAGYAYDASRERVVVFGGYDNSFIKQGDTWEWDGVAWQQKATTQAQPAGPGTRNGIAMTWDPVRERVVMMGGESGTAQHGDLWAWNGSTWTLIPATGLTPRVNHAMTYDTHRSRLITANGVRGAVTLGETWELITDPRIDAAVIDLSADVGQTVGLTVGASGTGALTYQWSKGSVPLADGGRYSGTATSTLVITGTRQIDAGEYFVTVTGPCGSTTRSHGALAVICRGNLDGSGGVTTADLTAFLALFGQSVSPSSPADFNQDGAINTADLVSFLAAFGSEC
ncbi:MAG: hypothetical protein ACKVZJ_05760 [Phycisphaerales bacterium]